MSKVNVFVSHLWREDNVEDFIYAMMTSSKLYDSLFQGWWWMCGGSSLDGV